MGLTTKRLFYNSLGLLEASLILGWQLLLLFSRFGRQRKKRPKISKKYRKIALFSYFQEGKQKRPKNSKKRPKNSTFKPLSTIFVPSLKILPPVAGVHGQDNTLKPFANRIFKDN